MLAPQVRSALNDLNDQVDLQETSSLAAGLLQESDQIGEIDLVTKFKLDRQQPKLGYLTEDPIKSNKLTKFSTVNFSQFVRRKLSSLNDLDWNSAENKASSIQPNKRPNKLP